MSEPFIGEIRLFGFDFTPKYWAQCNGQLLSIAQNSALFSLLGTTYGGDGRVTFGLPDLRGRSPIGQGQGQGLSLYQMGQVGGTEQVTLVQANLPPHSHPVHCFTDDTNQGTPQNNFPANIPNGYASSSNASMAPGMIGPAGNSQPVSTLSPYLTMNYCIATSGVFPSRS